MKITNEQIVEFLEEASLYPEKGLDHDVPFAEQGIDSLDRSTFYLNIEENFDVELPEDDEEKFNSIAKIVSFING